MQLVAQLVVPLELPYSLLILKKISKKLLLSISFALVNAATVSNTELTAVTFMIEL